MTRNNGATWTAANTGWTARINAIGVVDERMALGSDFGVLLRPLSEIVSSNYFSGDLPQVANASSRAVVSPGNPLIVGFVITGNAPKRLLVRGVGPGLSALGVAGALADPRLDIFSAARWDRMFQSQRQTTGRMRPMTVPNSPPPPRA